MNILEKFNLKGKVVLVTGGTHGIGMAIGTALGSARAKVCVNDIDDAKLASAKKEYASKGRDVFTVKFDVTNEEDVDKGIRAIENELRHRKHHIKPI